MDTPATVTNEITDQCLSMNIIRELLLGVIEGQGQWEGGLTFISD